MCYNIFWVKAMNKNNYYKKTFSYFKSEKNYILLYAIISLVIVAVNTITPVLEAKGLKAITVVDLSLMLKISLLIMIISIFNEFIRYFYNLISRKIQNHVEIKIKEDVSKELFCLEMKNFDKEGTGFFANRIENEPRVLASIFESLRFGLINFLTSIGVFIYVFFISPILGLFFLISSIILFYINFKRTKKWEEERKKDKEMRERYASNFGELIRGIKDIKVLNLKNFLIKKTIKEQKELILYDYEISKRDQKAYILIGLVHSMIDFLLIVIGVILIYFNMLSGTSFLIIYMYKHKVIYFLSDINSIYRRYKEFNLSLERLYEVIDGGKYLKEKFGTKKLENIKGYIEFKNVSFGYNDNKVLKNVDFKINTCETIGIVGKSGVGKTTIINLINKLYNLDDGSILIDDVNINEIAEDSLKKSIATITQNPYIFNMSIKDNLKIAKVDATDLEIEEKCKLCALDEYINSLPEKYDTLVGENGVILSGGLKQRLSIARALLKDSKIIMLDEATSSLDNETQDYIHNSIKKIKKDFTIIIIAHRLSTVIDCDKILVIDDGKVVGFDKHDNLIKTNQVYKKLYKKELV